MNKYETTFLAWIDEQREINYFSKQQLDLANSIWKNLKNYGNYPTPTAMVGEDNCLSLSWNPKYFSIVIEIHSDDRLEWWSAKSGAIDYKEGSGSTEEIVEQIVSIHNI